jgi:hypothetical protein
MLNNWREDGAALTGDVLAGAQVVEAALTGDVLAGAQVVEAPMALP